MCSLLKKQDNSLFIYSCIIRNQDTFLIVLINTYVIKDNFIYFQTAHVLCNINSILLYTLQNLIKVQGFNGQLTLKIIHKLTVYLKIKQHS
jgi:hypothetical protein